MSAMAPFRVVLVGGGIVGLATAWRLLTLRPGSAVTVLEKEPELGRHQSGRNSGVLHTGVYYRPGSAKARACAVGRRAMIDFCAEHGVRHEICGKVIVATREPELPRLEALAERALANGVEATSIGPERLAEIEPHARGLRALHLPGAGIVDFPGVVEALAGAIRGLGGEIRTGVRVFHCRELPDEVVTSTTAGSFHSDRVVNCGGLHADRIAAASGIRPAARIVPFRGEYHLLASAVSGLCRNLIYPVPDPALPFLGVHFTRTVDGVVECGPNAVLAFAREGYTWSRVDLGHLFDLATDPGFLRLASRRFCTGAGEMWRSLSRRAFARSLQALVPEVRAEHLRPGPAGVRAQAVARDGSLLDDFLIAGSARAIHVLNAPSPAATAALEIGRDIAERVLRSVDRERG